jgi:hypothetical protein
VPASLVVEATGPTGAVVSWAAPLAIDDVSGLVPVLCEPGSGSGFAAGQTAVTCAAADAAGNLAHQAFTVTVQDNRPPTVVVPVTVRATASSAAGAVVTFAASASDAVSGPVPVTCTPASGSTFAPGVTHVTCRATDAAANAGSAGFDVSVTFEWSGILAPVRSDGSSVFKIGRTVPVKFQLAGSSAGIANLAARILVAKVSDGIAGVFEDITSSSSADAGNLFRYDPAAGQYVFNLSTAPLSHGTWAIQVDLGDGESRLTTISLRP